jgi:glycolate oxidase iron-sulfur subunit
MTSPLPLSEVGVVRAPAITASARTRHARIEDILAESGRCVACGLCVPKCPTYRKTLSEADSPRGRIFLMRGAVEGNVPCNERLREHLDLCLGCRACEAACPNGVAYGRLFGEARSLAEIGRGRSTRSGLPPRWMLTSTALRAGGGLLRGYQRSGLARIARGSGILRLLGLERAERFLPPLPAASQFRPIYRAQGETLGEVILFLGCIARVVDGAALRAAIYVLTLLGYTVHVPPTQGCCGAMYHHAGDLDTALSLAAANERSFAVHPGVPVLATASGCAARLTEYGRDYGEAGGALAGRVQDVSAFIASAPGWDRVRVAPLEASVAVQDPCTLRNVLRSADAVYALLARIPGARVSALAGNDQCCGGAGAYFLSQPEMADELRADKLAAIAQAPPRYLVTSNVGCALVIGEGLRSSNRTTEVLHPITLVARQLGFKGVLA